MTALDNDDQRDAMWALSADVQASLALNRVVLQALAALSPDAANAADAALEAEYDRAMAKVAPRRLTNVLHQARCALQSNSEQARMAASLEWALLNAAEAVEAPSIWTE